MMNTVYYCIIHSSVLISIVSRILGSVPGQRFMNLLRGLCLAPAAQLLDLENNEELNLKVSIILAAVWLLVAGRRQPPRSADQETSIVNNIPFDNP